LFLIRKVATPLFRKKGLRFFLSPSQFDFHTAGRIFLRHEGRPAKKASAHAATPQGEQ
jgi:hypothetical protein